MTSPTGIVYTLKFPFRLAPHRTIRGIDGVQVQIDGRTYRFSARTKYVSVLVDGFESESAATDYIATIRTGLYWVAIQYGFGYTAELRLDAIACFEDPVLAAKNLQSSVGLVAERVDGLANGNHPCIFPTDSQVKFLTAGDIDISFELPADQFAACMSDGISKAKPTALRDERLTLALDLFCASSHEASVRARFVVLIMALETLTRERAKHPSSLDLLQRWTADLQEAKRRNSDDATAWNSLDALERELLFRRTDSVRSRIRALVHDTLVACGDTDASTAARRALALYDDRSVLVHEGTLPDVQLVADLTETEHLVKRILKAKLAGLA